MTLLATPPTFNGITYRVISYTEVERLIKEVFGKEVSIVALGEWSNDTEHAVYITPADTWSDYDNEEVNKFIEGESDAMYAPYRLLEALVCRKVLEAGHYLVKVRW